MKKQFTILLFFAFTVSAFADDLTFSVTNTAAGLNNGAIDMNVSGGIAPFTYSWSGPGGFNASTEDLSGLAGGTYTVTVTDSYCGTATTTVIVDASTDVAEQTNAASFFVYPNPANDQVTISASTLLKNATVKLIDLNGKTILESSNVSGNSFVFNVSGQAKGIYFVEITNDGNVSRKRIVKN